MDIIATDHEYIPENAAQGDTPGGRPDVRKTYCEVMQMGACKVDDDGNETEVLNLTVRGHQIKRIPQWLSDMTGMTEQKRAQGVTFPEALERLERFVGRNGEVWTFNGDWWVLEGNAKAHGIELPFEEPFSRVKPILGDLGITKSDYKAKGFDEACSGGLYKVCGLTLPEIEGVGAHDAAHDARSLAHSVHFLRDRIDQIVRKV